VASYLVHIGYTLTLAALLARDILWLRGLLVCAQSILATYAWQINVRTIATWNALFVLINVIWVVQILRERRAVSLPPDLKPIHEAHFAALTPGEFLRWWRQGRREQLHDAQITWDGRRPDALFFLLSGTARVSREGRAVTDLHARQFVGEMSLITGRAANADVSIVGDAEVVRWPTADLRAIQARQPALWSRLQSAIGHDLVEKIRRGESR
jgi:CRP-like cAMP-binding protein